MKGEFQFSHKLFTTILNYFAGKLHSQLLSAKKKEPDSWKNFSSDM